MADAATAVKHGMGELMLYTIIFLITGTAGVLLSKVQYQTAAMGKWGVHFFWKPWFVNTGMFVGMCLCLIHESINRCNAKKSAEKVAPKPPHRRATEGGDKKKRTPLFWLVALPGLCDFVATYFMNVGLLWIPTSVWQMLRGSIVIFTAFVRLTLLKLKIKKSEWLGVGIVTVSLMFVGVVGAYAPTAEPDNPDIVLPVPTTTQRGWGVVLVIVAQAVQALQTVIEEWLLHDVEASSSMIVGLEGFWGAVACIVVALPLAQMGATFQNDGDGLHENTEDTFIMLGNSPLLLWTTVAYVLVLLFFNLYGMEITDMTNAVSRNILEGVRTLFIWAAGLALHQLASSYGEIWCYPWSYLELVGFLILTVGLFYFYGVFKVKKWEVSDDDEEPLLFEGPPLGAPVNV